MVQIDQIFVAVLQRIMRMRMTVGLRSFLPFLPFLPFVFMLMMRIVDVQMLMRKRFVSMQERRISLRPP